MAVTVLGSDAVRSYDLNGKRLWELKEIYRPQGFFPHVYYGGMPQDEARKNMHLFATEVLPELKSWEAETSIDDRFLEAAEYLSAAEDVDRERDHPDVEHERGEAVE